jgi:uncharacterized protein YecT (DUF1311 family)
MRFSAAIVSLALLVSTPALAGPAKEDCGAQTNQTEMTACFNRDLDRANKKLNGVYEKRLEDMRDDPDGIKLLRAAERAWVDFRDRNCAAQAHGEEGGSVYATMVATCQIAMTDARTKEIQLQN